MLKGSVYLLGEYDFEFGSVSARGDATSEGDLKRNVL
jgi:hypothetical protein